MPGRVQELKIGPFSGGINNHSDKSAIADAESVDCVNFDIDLDGSLISRPPWSLFLGEKSPFVGATSTSFQLLLYSGVYQGDQFFVYQQNYPFDIGVGNGLFFRWNTGPFAGTDFPIAGPVSIYFNCIRNGNDLYIVSGAGGAVGGIKFNFVTNTATNIPTMPTGNKAVVYKGSMYVGGGANQANRSRISFSAPGDFTSWPSTNFFDINPGDGDALIDFLIYQDNLLIAKENSTYILAYDSNPAQAIVRLVNPTIGVMDRDCLTAYEGSIFFMYYDRVYEMVNYDFVRVNTKVPFDTDKTIIDPYGFTGLSWRQPTWCKTVGDRLLCRFYNRLYVYQLRLRSWTRWVSADPFIQYVGPPLELDRAGMNVDVIPANRQYIASTSLNKCMDSQGPVPGPNQQYLKLVLINDDFNYDNTTRENANITTAYVDIKCTLLTKIYDIGISHRFKRLMHWGVDVVSARDITGTLFPFSVAYRNTWDDLAFTPWSALNTWGHPLFVNPQFTRNTAVTSGVFRRFLRFPKSMRFRLLQFQVDMLTVGNTTDGPARLYTITAFIGSKQLVPAAVN